MSDFSFDVYFYDIVKYSIFFFSILQCATFRSIIFHPVMLKLSSNENFIALPISILTSTTMIHILPQQFEIFGIKSIKSIPLVKP
jgi:hypothetical protein